ncbi:MAG: hypothetical protein FWG90_01525 [Oscillospiraceae bacterium]|nr:hypothetical protein [Oscillospiraceae bacterium]
MSEWQEFRNELMKDPEFCEEYEKLQQLAALIKTAKNKAYLDELDRSMNQIANGKGQIHELIEVF